jgi:hypothetical protein
VEGDVTRAEAEQAIRLIHEVVVVVIEFLFNSTQLVFI